MRISGRFWELLGLWVLLLAPAPAQDAGEREIQEISKATGMRLNAVTSKSFLWGLEPSPGQARMVVAATEKAFKQVLRLAGLANGKSLFGRKPPLMMVLKNRLQYGRFIDWYGARHAGPYLWPGFAEFFKKRSYCPQPMPRVMGAGHLKPTDMKGMRNVMVHVLGHLCIQRASFNNHPIPPWMEEGFATYLEGVTMHQTQCYCFKGGYGDLAATTDKLTGLPWSKWKGLVGGRVRHGSYKHMRQLLRLSLNKLTADDIAKCWSVIDFLLKKNPKAFFHFVEVMKQKWPKSYNPAFSPDQEKAQASALKTAFNLDFEQLDAGWRKYVQETYP